jgi:hypothetical protein
MAHESVHVTGSRVTRHRFGCLAKGLLSHDRKKLKIDEPIHVRALYNILYRSIYNIIIRRQFMYEPAIPRLKRFSLRVRAYVLKFAISPLKVRDFAS